MAIEASKVPCLAFQVFRKEELPPRWHYQSNERIAPVLVVSSPGVHVFPSNLTWEDVVADHGYDNEDDSMRPVFLARGASFARNATLTQDVGIENVYSLTCHLLGIQGNPSNGSAALFSPILVTQ